MPARRFPDPRSATPEGVVAVGGDLEPDTLLSAYRQGIFPWPVVGLPLLWFSPPARGVLDFADLHLPRSLRRARGQSSLRLTLDTAFADVIRGCASTPRPEQEGTWITPAIESAYVRLHRLGVAHSAEAWAGDRLVGGVYGVDVGGAFAAESMFYRHPNASKLALLHLVEHLSSRGLDWLDIQVLTPHLARLGAHEVARDAFLERLATMLERGLVLFPPPGTRAG